jgi:integrase
MSRRPLWQYLLLDWAIWVLAGLIADAIEPRHRALVLLATFGNLRWGELAGLRRRNLDLDDRCVRVTETVYEFGQLVKGTPKSRASIRTVVLPELIIPELRRHLDTFAGYGPDGFVFVGVKGGQLRRSNSPSRGRGPWPKLGYRPGFMFTIFAIPATR